MTTLINNIRFAMRQLLRQPVYTGITVLILALGIGAGTAIFSIINGMLYKPLPVQNPRELRQLFWDGSDGALNGSYRGNGLSSNGRNWRGSFSYPVYCQLRDDVSEFSSLFAYCSAYGATAIANGTATTTKLMLVSHNFFTGYGVQPFLGRTFVSEDEGPTSTPVAVISHRFWKRHFNGDPEALGQPVTLNNHVFTIVGVLPEGFIDPTRSGYDVYAPANSSVNLSGTSLTAANDCWIQISGRIKPGIDDAKAKAACDLAFSRVLTEIKRSEEDYAHIFLADANILKTGGKRTNRLWISLGAVGIVLLIACSNVAGMLLSRGAARTHEMAIRAAIGAQQKHLLHLALIESFILSVLAAGTGLILSVWFKQKLISIYCYNTHNYNFDIDAGVLLFTTGLALITPLLFGLLPAWRVSKTDPLLSLGNSRIQGGRHIKVGKVLVAAQIGLSLALVVFATLLARTIININNIDPGINTENLLIFNVNAQQAGYKGDASTDFCRQLQDEIQSLPGVQNVSFANCPILRGSYMGGGFDIVGKEDIEKDTWSAGELCIDENYFKTMGIPLIQGRQLNTTDTKNSTLVCVINESIAKLCFPNENPIGHYLKQSGKNYQIGGVCKDVRYRSVKFGFEPVFYTSWRQNYMMPWGTFYMVRTEQPPLTLASSIRAIVQRLDPTIPVSGLTTQQDLINGTFKSERVEATLYGILAGMGLLLACIGLYGMMSYTITCRTQEIGLRIALGASSSDITRTIMQQVLILALIGIVIGLPIALFAARIFQKTVYGISTHDPLTLSLAAIILLLVSLLAAWIPVRRATKIDPMEALRYE